MNKKIKSSMVQSRFVTVRKNDMGKRYAKLNDFEREAPYEVFTGSGWNKKAGRKVGKYLQFKETVNNFADGIESDCIHSGENKQCKEDILTEDLPDFCIFGKTCVQPGVRKEITQRDKEASKIISGDPNEEYFERALQNVSDEELEFIF